MRKKDGGSRRLGQVETIALYLYISPYPIVGAAAAAQLDYKDLSFFFLLCVYTLYYFIFFLALVLRRGLFVGCGGQIKMSLAYLQPTQSRKTCFAARKCREEEEEEEKKREEILLMRENKDREPLPATGRVGS